MCPLSVPQRGEIGLGIQRVQLVLLTALGHAFLSGEAGQDALLPGAVVREVSEGAEQVKKPALSKKAKRAVRRLKAGRRLRRL